jgi:hypothetical protein
MLRCKMTIDTMAVTNSKKPIILDRAEILHNDVLILVHFLRLAWYIACSSFECILDDWVLDTYITKMLMALYEIFLASF